MMNPRFHFVGFTVILELVATATALQCFSCAHNVELPVPPPPFSDQYHDNCKNGSVPIDKFLVTCPDDDLESNLACGMVLYDGKLPLDTPYGVLTRRDCMRWDPSIPDGCQTYLVKDIDRFDENTPQLVKSLIDFIYPFEEDATIDICVCRGDKCKFGNEEDDNTTDDNKCQLPECSSSTKLATAHKMALICVVVAYVRYLI